MKSYKKSKSLMLLVLLFLICIPIKNYASSPPKEINILVLLTNHHTLPWTQAYIQGLEKARLEYGDKVNFFVENLATQYLGDDFSPHIWTDYFSHKYKNIHIDAVLAESNIASRFFNEHGRKIFKEIPFIYYVTTEIALDSLSKSLSGANGLATNKTFQLALKQNPKAKQIYIVDGENYQGTIFVKELLNEIKKRAELEVHVLKDFSFDTLKQQVANLPKESILFFTLTFEDNTGRRIAPQKLVTELGEVSSVPIYTFHSPLLGKGIVGGHMIDAGITAKQMVKAAMDYINKGHFEEEYVNTITYVDWQSVKRYGIDTASIPNDAIVLNKPLSLWESHRYEVIFVSLVILILVILIFLLAINMNKLKRETILRVKQEAHLIQQSKMAAMGEMLSIITHQWRQPLTTISMVQNNILLDIELGALDPNNFKNSVDAISNQIKHMAETIEDFRNFFKPNIELKTFIACAQILVVQKLLSAKFKTLNVTFVTNKHEHFGVFGIPNELSQVLMNIYNNACDVFEEQNSAQRKIENFCENDGTMGIIRIRDTGGGIPEELLPDTLFESYVTTKGKKGTGIGLWLSKTIIEEHFKGKLWAHNVENGAEFVIEIPIVHQ